MLSNLMDAPFEMATVETSTVLAEMLSYPSELSRDLATPKSRNSHNLFLAADLSIDLHLVGGLNRRKNH
jgi:hypothetical protein